MFLFGTGVIIVNTGDGKGKTTAAMGVAMRSLVHGYRVALVQFMKNPDEFEYAEKKLENFFSKLSVFTMGTGFTWNSADLSIDKAAAGLAWNHAKKLVLSNEYDLVILDEILVAISCGLLEESEVLDFLQSTIKLPDIILTGRGASTSVIALADLVSEIKNIKHPFDTKGTLARKGIDW